MLPISLATHTTINSPFVDGGKEENIRLTVPSFSAVMQQSFRFAVFPKQYITFNPMQYIKLRYQTDEVDLFSDEDMDGNIPVSYTHLSGNKTNISF